MISLYLNSKEQRFSFLFTRENEIAHIENNQKNWLKNVCVYLSYLINFQLLLQVWRFVYDFKAFYSFRVQAILYRFRVTAGKLNDIILLKVNILSSYIILFDMRKNLACFMSHNSARFHWTFHFQILY